MSVLNLITDRTQFDVQQAENLFLKTWDEMTESEKVLWNNGLRGAYNDTDMNRVGGAVSYIKQRLENMGYMVNVTAKQDWNIKDILNPEKSNSYLSDIREMRNVFDSTNGLFPPVPSDLDGLNEKEANNIEKILVILNGLITNVQKSQIYCGELFSGEV